MNGTSRPLFGPGDGEAPHVLLLSPWMNIRPVDWSPLASITYSAWHKESTCIDSCKSGWRRHRPVCAVGGPNTNMCYLSRHLLALYTHLRPMVSGMPSAFPTSSECETTRSSFAGNLGPTFLIGPLHTPTCRSLQEWFFCTSPSDLAPRVLQLNEHG